MRIYIDENISHYIALGFQHLQIPNNKLSKHNFEILSIKDVFGQGVADEDWIPKVGAEKACVITQDFNIQRTRHQRALCDEHKVGIFYISPPSKKGFSYWEMVKLLMKIWPDLTDLAHHQKLPFTFRCNTQGKLVALEK